MTASRWQVLRAADAPAPSIVIEGSKLAADAPRAEYEAFAGPVRADILRGHSDLAGLGIKTVVVRPVPGARLRVEFFQGYAHGPLMQPSPLTCINSLGCAVVAARAWFPWHVATPTVLAVMGGCEYALGIGIRNQQTEVVAAALR